MVFENARSPDTASKDTIDTVGIGQMQRRQEFAWLGLILVIGVLPRLLFVTFFPTIPISDFLSLLNFAIVFRDDWIAKDAWQWHYFSPGLPLLLSVILRVVSAPPDTVARWATAFLTGLVPILPYLLWKSVLPPRTRIIAALLLALWPSQILFSSVFAQDNWILFPTVAIAVLAVRVFVTKEAGTIPMWSALLYAVTTAIRQEMMIVLFPITLLAMMGGKRENRLRNALTGIAIIGVVFAGLIIQRGLATGLYTLSTQHFGKAILGAYVPGAGMGWIDPIPYAKATYPEFRESGDPDNKLAQIGLRLAWQEFAARPGFHGIRIFGSTLTHLFKMNGQLVWWSLLGEGILPSSYQQDADALVMNLSPLLQIYPVAINLLFVCSLIFASRHSQLSKWITPLVVTIVLKISLHAVIVSQPRYFLVVIALEILMLSIVWNSMLNRDYWKLSLRSILLGTVSILILLAAMNSAKDYIQKHDIVLRFGDAFSIHVAEVIAAPHGKKT